jgi:hypothetical protein
MHASSSHHGEFCHRYRIDQTSRAGQTGMNVLRKLFFLPAKII